MLVDRLRAVGHDNDHRLVGRSSTALLLEVFGDGPVPLHSYPLDGDDLGRCRATVHRLPAHRREAGRAILARFAETLRVDCAAHGGHKRWLLDDGTCWKCGDLTTTNVEVTQ